MIPSNEPPNHEEPDDFIVEQERFDDFTYDEYLIVERPYLNTEPNE